MKSVISSTPSPLFSSEAETNLEDIPVLAIADRSVPGVSQDASVDCAIELATAAGTHALPVIDDQDQLVGMVFVDDALYEQSADARIVDIMDPHCPVLPSTANAAQAAAVMAFESVGWVAVVDVYHRLFCVVTASEIMRWLARSAGYQV